MKKQNTYTYKHIVMALGCAVIGLGLLFIKNSIINNIGSILLISGIYTILDNMFVKESLIELVVQKVGLDKEIDNTGLIRIDSTITNINYKDFFINASDNIDIVHNYARTWTTNNFDFIKNTVMNKECTLRVVLLNPKSPFVPALEKHYNYSEGQLTSLIDEVSQRWYGLYNEIETKKKMCKGKGSSRYKNTKCGTIEMYYFNGQPTNSIYRIDNKIIVVNAKNSKQQSVYLPYYILQNNGDAGLYALYLKEIETIISESEEIDFLEVKNENN